MGLGFILAEEEEKTTKQRGVLSGTSFIPGEFHHEASCLLQDARATDVKTVKLKY